MTDADFLDEVRRVLVNVRAFNKQRAEVSIDTLDRLLAIADRPWWRRLLRP